MGRPAQLQPEKRSRQGRHLLFLHTKRLEIRGSRQIFLPYTGVRAVFFGVTCAVVRKVYGKGNGNFVKKEFRKKKKVVSLIDLKEMKTQNDCEIACDCVKRANVVLHVEAM